MTEALQDSSNIHAVACIRSANVGITVRHSIPSPNGHQSTKDPNFFIQWSIRSKPDYSPSYGKFVDSEDIWRKSIAFLLLLPSSLFFSTKGAMLNTQAFIWSTLFDILFQLEGFYSVKSLRIYAFSTKMQGLGIDPWRSVSKLDMLTSDPLGKYVY